MSTFVIIHGAWAGAWAWVRVSDRLRSGGHRVHVPPLSGLGERCHLASFPVDLSTHVDDVVNEITFNDLTEIVLVMHSYGGLIGPCVVERLSARMAALVFVDAFVPADGDSFTKLIPGFEIATPLTPAPPTSEGDYFSEDDRRWVDAMATPQPSATLTEPVRLAGTYLDVPKKTYVLATGWNGFAAVADRFRGRPAWDVRELNCGHDVAIDMPAELVAILEGAA